MKELPPLDGLSPSEKDALIQGLWQELQTLRSEVEKLKQKRVKKTSRNSSLPPSKGFKPNQSHSRARSLDCQETGSHRQGGREVSQQPDQVGVAQAKRYPPCGVEVDLSTQPLSGIDERIELPPITAHMTRVERYGGICQCCRQAYEAPVPVGLEPGSPFGTRVATLVTYLRYSPAISYQRLSQLMSELYGLKLSEGAIANLLQRVHAQLETPGASRMVERLRSARLVCLKAIALQRRRHTLAASTIEQYGARFRGLLREILHLQPKSVEGQRWLKRYQKIRAHLLMFLTDETIPPTNNSSEQALRWSVVFDQVTNGFRSEWGAMLFAQGRSLVNTAQRQGISALDAISRALTSQQTDWLLG